MPKDYIFNLEVIPETFQKFRNPQDVNAVVTRRNNKGFYLVLHTSSGEELQLTKEKRMMFFPLEPIAHLYQKLGTFYMENFIVCNENMTCINKNNIKDFSLQQEQIKKRYYITTTFKNGTTVRTSRFYKKEKGLKKEFDALIKALKNEGPSYIL